MTPSLRSAGSERPAVAVSEGAAAAEPPHPAGEHDRQPEQHPADGMDPLGPGGHVHCSHDRYRRGRPTRRRCGKKAPTTSTPTAPAAATAAMNRRSADAAPTPVATAPSTTTASARVTRAAAANRPPGRWGARLGPLDRGPYNRAWTESTLRMISLGHSSSSAPAPSTDAVAPSTVNTVAKPATNNPSPSWPQCRCARPNQPAGSARRTVCRTARTR